MRISLRAYLTDRDGNERSTGFFLPSLSSVGEAENWANAFEAALSGVSNAYVTRAQVVISVPGSTAGPAAPNTNIWERLYILCTNGTTFASVSIPAPLSTDYDTDGPYRDIRIQKGQNPTSSLIAALLAALQDAVLPDGTPFPTLEWVAGRGMNQ